MMIDEVMMMICNLFSCGGVMRCDDDGMVFGDDDALQLSSFVVSCREESTTLFTTMGWWGGGDGDGDW